MNHKLEKFDRSLEEFNIRLNEEQRDQFIRFYELLIEWNSFMNLTAITEFDEVIEKHFLDSLSIVKVKDLTDQSLLDLGTGAGFPGIPIKIVFPNIKITLVDSLNKRVQFLNQVIEDLGLEGIEAVHGRAEDLARKDEYREQYDICVSRAVANLATLSEYCLPFVKCDGSFISYKAEAADKEILEAKKAISLCGGVIEKKESFQLPYTKYGRNLICIQKISKTDKKYPRKAGLPSKEPLS